MKNLLRKNQVIITALVIMVAVAGYLSFTSGKGSLDTVGEVVQSTDATAADSDAVENDLYLEVNDTLDEAKATASPATTADPLPTATDTDADAANDEYADISAEDIGNDDTQLADSDTDSADASDDSGEAVLVSNTIDADFFSEARVSREQTRSKNKETLMDIVNNANCTTEEKQNAIDEVIAMTETADKENAAEILLEAKGFTDVVVSVVDDSVDVLVNGENLTEQQMAQIEDVVKRKTGISADKIVITPVGVTK